MCKLDKWDDSGKSHDEEYLEYLKNRKIKKPKAKKNKKQIDSDLFYVNGQIDLGKMDIDQAYEWIERRLHKWYDIK